MDESGYYLLPFCKRTYAPSAQTPTLRVRHTRDHVSVMSGVTASGGLYSMMSEQALDDVAATHFLHHLRRWIDRKLLVIWDRSPIHRSLVMRDYLENGGAKYVHLEALPPYAPDLNPDECVWRHTKCVDLANVCCLDLADLSVQIRDALERLRRRPALIRSFFSAAGLVI